MKNFWIILLLISGLIISGCASSIPNNERTTTFYNPDGTVNHIEEFDGAPPTSSPEENAARMACYITIDKAKSKESEMINKLPDNMKAMVLQAQKFTDLIAQMEKATIYDACDSGDKNVYDYLIVDTQESNRTRREAVSAVGSAVPFIALGYAIKKGVDAAGDNVAGDQYKAGRDNKIAGKNVNDSSTNIIRSSEANPVTVGDDNYTSSGSPTLGDTTETVETNNN